MENKAPRSGVLIAPENCNQLQLALAAGQGRATQRCLLPAQLLELAAAARFCFEKKLERV